MLHYSYCCDAVSLRQGFSAAPRFHLDKLVRIMHKRGVQGMRQQGSRCEGLDFEGYVELCFQLYGVCMDVWMDVLRTERMEEL